LAKAALYNATELSKRFFKVCVPQSFQTRRQRIDLKKKKKKAERYRERGRDREGESVQAREIYLSIDATNITPQGNNLSLSLFFFLI